MPQESGRTVADVLRRWSTKYSIRFPGHEGHRSADHESLPPLHLTLKVPAPHACLIYYEHWSEYCVFWPCVKSHYRRSVGMQVLQASFPSPMHFLNQANAVCKHLAEDATELDEVSEEPLAVDLVQPSSLKLVADVLRRAAPALMGIDGSWEKQLRQSVLCLEVTLSQSTPPYLRKSRGFRSMLRGPSPIWDQGCQFIDAWIANTPKMDTNAVVGSADLVTLFFNSDSLRSSDFYLFGPCHSWSYNVISTKFWL